MSDDIVILRLSDRARWEQLESGPIMPSQCWRFAHALSASGYEPRLAIVDAGGSRLLLPFIEQHGSDHVDIATLPGLSGASIRPASSAPLLLWQEFAAAQGWVTGYIQLAAETYPNVTSELSPVHQTHMFLLDPCLWNRRRTASSIIRRKVSAALRAGATISENRDVLGLRLAQLYPAMLRWFGSRSILSTSTLCEWARDQRNMLMGVSIDGAVEGVHLVHVQGDYAEFHLAGISERGRALSALLYVAVIERLQEMGIRRCNLGGGGNPGDGLFMFKSWLGATPVPQQSVRQVYNTAQYESLCTMASVPTDSKWFPAYRSAQSSHAAPGQTGSLNDTTDEPQKRIGRAE